ncbi:MAG: imidazoleglycerol-phosphate dehydratase HisB [Candidatus Altiarchaeota archaeon]|nr:imidazoleglycerol-phosphate dehydratase HisB [Candidatus Altiarchaeota archaeon]
MRTSNVVRKTEETQISLELNLDGVGRSEIKTPLKFMNHMLENFSKHSRFDLKINASGDVEVDDHHLVEDLGICLGQALDKALDDKKGIARMGSCCVPMDDALAHVALDLSGRAYARVDIPFSEFKEAKLGDVSKEALPHFFDSFTSNGKLNLHITVDGVNDHHKVEACFKALAKALYEASRVIHGDTPSTKGVL